MNQKIDAHRNKKPKRDIIYKAIVIGKIVCTRKFTTWKLNWLLYDWDKLMTSFSFSFCLCIFEFCFLQEIRSVFEIFVTCSPHVMSSFSQNLTAGSDVWYSDVTWGGGVRGLVTFDGEEGGSKALVTSPVNFKKCISPYFPHQNWVRTVRY